MIVEVTYMSGAGNLFSVLDLRNNNFSEKQLSKLAVLLCNPNQFNGIRTEGLLAISDISKQDTDFSVYFNNPDGTFGMMCGNGGRCAIKFANKYGFTSKNDVKFSFADTVYQGFSGEMIDIIFDPPLSFQENVAVNIDDKIFNGTYVDVGTQHFVYQVKALCIDDFKKYNVKKMGEKIRWHNDFAPKGINVNFYCEWNGKLLVRTFERGVEAETGACGTGAISTVFAHSINNKIKDTVEVIPSSGQALYVTFIKNNERLENISLRGNAEIIGSQEINLPVNYMEL